MTMNVNAARTILLGTLFVIVIMAIYFALLPSAYFQRDQNGHADGTYGFPKTKDEFSARRNKQLKNDSHWIKDKVSLVRPADPETSVQVATEIFRKRGVVLFTMINDAYFDFAASWCCNTGPLDHVHQHVLFLTTDFKTGERLKALWPNVTVVSEDGSQFQGVLKYSRAGYVRMMAARTRFVLRLLEAGLRLLLFEVDCLWLADPLPLLLARRAQGDILATKVSGVDVTAGGFLFINPTAAAVKLWRRLTQLMEGLEKRLKQSPATAAVSESQNDQQFFSSLVRSRYAGIKVVYLPPDAFPDGKWYGLPEAARSAKPPPVIINNNWLIGGVAKIRRAKAFGHWFWNDKGGACNSTALRSLFG